MTERWQDQPTAQDVRDLLAFLPKLYADGFEPVKRVHSKDQDGEIVAFPWPEYNQTVEDFLAVARRDCWMDGGYDPAEVGRLIESEDAIRTATLAQVRAMITYFVRGERFCDGHWGHMIEEGYVRRILERLAELERGLDEGERRSRR